MKIGTLALATFMAFTSGTAALAQSDFYRGKQLKIVVGSEAGGGFSSYSLLLSAHLGKHIPGNPAVSIEHRPGSGGVNAIRLSRQCRAERRHGDRRRHAELLRHPLRRTERRKVQSGPVPLPRPDERFRTRAGELACNRREDHRRSESQGNLHRGIGAPLDHVDPADTRSTKSLAPG